MAPIDSGLKAVPAVLTSQVTFEPLAGSQVVTSPMGQQLVGTAVRDAYGTTLSHDLGVHA